MVHLKFNSAVFALTSTSLKTTNEPSTAQIQTKFTSIHGQDPNKMPYDPRLSITDQVHTSIKSSLHNLRPSPESSSADTTVINCLVLHSPLPTIAETLEAWRTAESYVPHKIRNLGISNTPMSTLEQLYEAAKVKPAVVQNRFYPDTQFDKDVRAFCVEKGIIYQSFWTLSANPKVVHGAEVGAVYQAVGLDSVQEAMYCLTLALDNVVVLNGTKNEEHMRGDMKAVGKARMYAEKNPDEWKGYVERFRALI